MNATHSLEETVAMVRNLVELAAKSSKSSITALIQERGESMVANSRNKNNGLPVTAYTCKERQPRNPQVIHWHHMTNKSFDGDRKITIVTGSFWCRRDLSKQCRDAGSD